MAAPTLILRCVDVHDTLLGENVDIRLRHQGTGQLKVVQVPTSKSAAIANLSGGVYQVQADPASYLGTGCFVDVAGSGKTTLTMTFPVDAAKVKEVDFPAFKALTADAKRILADTQNLLGFGGLSGAALYDELDDIRKAGLLNIFAKSAATIFPNGRAVDSYIMRLNELRGDRFFAVVPQELREETKNSVADGLFHDVPEGMHHPPSNFDHAGSYKTHDHYGNLQLTFFTNGTDWVADIDIDDGAGLAHVFQVLRNQLTGRPTHPYDIHEILIAHQRLEPGYELDV
jgi:hypothetical protein